MVWESMNRRAYVDGNILCGNLDLFNGATSLGFLKRFHLVQRYSNLFLNLYFVWL